MHSTPPGAGGQVGVALADQERDQADADDRRPQDPVRQGDQIGRSHDDEDRRRHERDADEQDDDDMDELGAPGHVSWPTVSKPTAATGSRARRRRTP